MEVCWKAEPEVGKSFDGCCKLCFLVPVELGARADAGRDWTAKPTESEVALEASWIAA